MSQAPAVRADAPVTVGFMQSDSYKLAKSIALDLAASTLVPKSFQNNAPNCLIALNMANRIGADPLMVMQNLYIVHGNPGWSSQFLIATFNSNPKFSALRYEFKGTEGADDWSCRAYATEKETGQVLYGAWISIKIAKGEGWYGKTGSKWQTMPQQMLMYRAASWFVRAYAPEIAMGLQTAEEVYDTIDLQPDNAGTFVQPEQPKASIDDLLNAMPGGTDKRSLSNFVEQCAKGAGIPVENLITQAIQDVDKFSKAHADWISKNHQQATEEPSHQAEARAELAERRAKIDYDIKAYDLDRKQIETACNAFVKDMKRAQIEKAEAMVADMIAAAEATMAAEDGTDAAPTPLEKGTCPHSGATVRVGVECAKCDRAEGCPGIN